MTGMWGQPQAPPTMWGASPAAGIKPSGPAAAPMPDTRSGPPAPGQIKSLEEIEAEMARMMTSDVAPPAAAAGMARQQPPHQAQQTQGQQAQGPQVMSLEEIERQMMSSDPAIASHASAPTFTQAQAPAQQRPQQVVPPTREVTPPQIKLAGSGYASSQALLDSMFPELGAAPASGVAGPGVGAGTADFPVMQPPAGPSPEEIAHRQAIQERVQAKIEAMSEHNHLMGNSDKDFITRIQLSQLATADPYTSDFYAQVFSAIRGPRPGPEGPAQQGQNGGKDIVPVAPGYALGVSGPAGNRFGKMGQQTMQKLSTQVKKLVESRDLKYKNAQHAGELCSRVIRGTFSSYGSC